VGARQIHSFNGVRQVGFNPRFRSLLEQPQGLFDQKPRHPAPNDQDCNDYKGGGIDVLGARHGLVKRKSPAGAGLEGAVMSPLSFLEPISKSPEEDNEAGS
jgi:hypothetical protein